MYASLNQTSECFGQFKSQPVSPPHSTKTPADFPVRETTLFIVLVRGVPLRIIENPASSFKSHLGQLHLLPCRMVF